MDISRRELIAGTSGFVIGTGVSGLGSLHLVESNNNTNNESNSQDSLDIETENRVTLGDSDAPIKMYYWSDYQCPFCYRFESDSLPQLRSQFIDSGTVELIIKPLDAFGEDSYTTALGSHCVYNQVDSEETFLEWHNMLYETYQDGNDRNNGWGSASNQSQYASEFNSIEGDELQSCIENQTHRQKIQVDKSEGREQGLEGTPFFVVYNTETQETTTISGAQPYTIFEDKIASIQQ